MRLRTLVWVLLRWSGVLWLWRFYHRSEITILMLHGVMDAEQPSSWTPLRSQLSHRSLETALRLLSKYYQFVSLSDAVGMLTGQQSVRPYSLVLTFDDGYRNNLTHALPILQKYGAPATFFVVPGHIERRAPFWFDRLDYVLQHADLDDRVVSIGDATIRFQGKDRQQLKESYRILREAAKAMSQDLEMQRELDTLAKGLERETGRRLADICEEDSWSAILSWPDVRAALAQSVTIGSHTVDHVRVGLVDLGIARDQLKRSKQMIEAQTGQPCKYFCYPNGSVTKAVTDLARECGYEAAVTTEEGTNCVGEDLLLLRRINFPDTGDHIETLINVSGLSLVVARYKAWLRSLMKLKRLASHIEMQSKEKDSPFHEPVSR